MSALATAYSFVTAPPVRVFALKFKGEFIGEEFATRAAAYRRCLQLAVRDNTSALNFRVEEILL